MNNNNRLLIVDDSQMMRNVISDLFSTDSTIEVIATAESGAQALEIIESERPDVVTLDINMPDMDGLTTLKHLMIHSPTPTVMLSSLSRDGAKITFDALRYGAVDFITKPSHLEPQKMQSQALDMIHKVKCAAAVKMDIVRYIRPDNAEQPSLDSAYKFVVAMGAAEGGYSSLLTILPKLSASNPMVYLVVLYSAVQTIDAFIDYLNSRCALRVKRAQDGDIIQAGTCYIVSGEEYMTLYDNGQERLLRVHPAPFISQNGAINCLMFSLADVLGEHAIGILLSGSGNDGSEGLEEIKRMGGYSLVQNPANCLYKTMSESALNHGAVDKVFSAAEIAENLNSCY